MTSGFLFIGVLVLTSLSVEGVRLQQDVSELRPLLHPTYNDRLLLFADHLRAAQRKNVLEGRPLSARVPDPGQLLGELLGLSHKQFLEAAWQSLTRLQERFVVSAGDLKANATVSDVCLNHSAAILSGLTSRESWAVQMLDAMGKPRAGISELNLNWPGAYHQCLQVRATTSVVAHPQFSGEYCTASIVLPRVSAGGFSLFSPELLIGLCIPDTCSETDVAVGIQQVLHVLNATALSAGPAKLSYRATTIDTRSTVAAVICGLFALLMILGTVLDFVLGQRPKGTSEACKSDIAFNGHNVDPQTSETQLLLTKARDEVNVDRPQPGLWSKALISFSVWTNGRKLLSTSQPESSLTCMHGVRFLTLTWVVLGHCLSITLTIGVSENMSRYLQELTKRWTFQAIANSTVSVDSFFVMSGLLVTFLTLKEMKKNNGKLNWFSFFFHRFWRLTPVYMLCIMIYVCFMRYWGEGPFWPRTVSDRDNCEQNWWTNLLYINNIVKRREACFGHAWYLANDMQFYILSPLIFVPLFFYRVAGLAIAVVFLLVTSITPAVLVLNNDFPPAVLVSVKDTNATNLQDYMKDFYFKPYNRMGPYAVGMLAGYFLFRTDCKWKINKYVNLFLWAVATTSALAVIFGLYDNTNGHPVTVQVSALYNAVHCQVWGACVAWVIVACATGNGGFVNTLLSWSALVPPSRLTYCVYLIHLMVLDLYIYNLQDLFYASDINMVALFLAVLVISYMAAFVVSLAFEAPMMGLEKVLTSALSSKGRRH